MIIRKSKDTITKPENQNLTFQQDIDYSLQKLISFRPDSSEKKNFSEPPFTQGLVNSSFQQSLEKQFEQFPTTKLGSNTLQIDSLFNNIMVKNQRSQEDPLCQSAMSFDQELNEKLQQLEGQKRLLLGNSPAKQLQAQQQPSSNPPPDNSQPLQSVSAQPYQGNQPLPFQSERIAQQTEKPSTQQASQPFLKKDLAKQTNRKLVKEFNDTAPDAKGQPQQPLQSSLLSSSQRVDPQGVSPEKEDSLGWELSGQQSQLLNPLEIVSDRQTLEFLLKYFSNGANEIVPTIKVVNFLDCLQAEFEDLFRGLSAEQYAEFAEVFTKMFTTNNPKVVSINALELHTREMGLFNKIAGMAQDVKYMHKIRSQETLNETIVSEISALKDMMDKKHKVLQEQEKKQAEVEKQLYVREKNLKSVILDYYEKIAMMLEESFKSKITEINKKSQLVERNLKNKIKVLEQKQKEQKLQSQTQTNQEEKWKNKAASLEKQNEFLKAKVLDLEKKLVEERDINTLLQNKNETLKQKLQQNQQAIKELTTQKKTSELYQLSGHQQPLSNQPKAGERDSNEITESLIQASNLQENMNLSDKRLNLEEIRASPIKQDVQLAGDQTIFEIKDVLRGEIAPAEVSAVAAKKTAGTKKKSAAQKESDEDAKVLLSLLNNMIQSLKSTLPQITYYIKAHLHSDENQEDSSAIVGQLDFGELFYANYSNIVQNLVDLSPAIFTRPIFRSNYIYNFVDLLYRVIFFHAARYIPSDFRAVLPQEVLEAAKNRAKSQLDHVNEVMHNITQPMQVAFIPQTSFWKLKFKSTSKQLKNQKLQAQSASTLPSAQFHSTRSAHGQQYSNSFQQLSFFQKDDIQKELLAIFRSYCDQQVLFAKKKTVSGNAAKGNQSNQFTIDVVPLNLQIESLKYTVMTKVHLLLLMLIMAQNSKDCFYSFQQLNKEICNENEALNEFIKQYVIEIQAIELIIWRISDCCSDVSSISEAINFLLNMSQMGQHYQKYIAKISSKHFIDTLFTIFDAHFSRNEICEKVAVILQRISYHSQTKQLFGAHQTQLLQEKINQQNTGDVDEFLISNLKAILNNVI